MAGERKTVSQGQAQTPNAPLLSGPYVDLGNLLALRVRRLPPRRRTLLRRGQPAGVRTSKLRGRGIDFSEVRLYQPGDDVRRIEWRVTARKNKPHTKVFQEERERPVLIVVDQSQSLFFGSRRRLKSVAAAECAALAAWRALANDDRVGGVIIGNDRSWVHKPLRSVKAVARLLADLAAANQALNRHSRLRNRAVYAEGLADVRRLAQSGFQIVLISDFLTAADAWRDLLRGLARHNDLSVMHVADPLEHSLPRDDRYAITDGQAHRQFHSGNASLRRAYAERFAERQRTLRRLCVAETVHYLPIPTDGDAGHGHPGPAPEAKHPR